MKSVEIFTDGACSGNPGSGGYGAILKYNGHVKEISEGFKCTTNNRMELLAAITALEMLKEPCSVTLYSDSKYLVDSVNLGWIEKWKANGWKRNSKEKAKNRGFGQNGEIVSMRTAEQTKGIFPIYPTGTRQRVFSPMSPRE